MTVCHVSAIDVLKVLRYLILQFGSLCYVLVAVHVDLWLLLASCQSDVSLECQSGASVAGMSSIERYLLASFDMHAVYTLCRQYQCISAELHFAEMLCDENIQGKSRQLWTV